MSTLCDLRAAMKQILSRVAAVVLGFVLTITGLAMTATIVMWPVGMLVGLLGIEKPPLADE